jgi:glutathione-regulated potassium-efflux system ancillary protein KefG
VLFAHPAFERSRVNRALLEAVRGLEGVTVHDLYEAYPDFAIDVPREQRLLVEHDVIVWQHPFYWYSSPALLKEWLDLVLEHGFAFGAEGRALEGKWALQAITTGGGEESYARDGSNGRTIAEFLAPFEQTARLCRMTWLPPFVVHGTHRFASARDAAPHVAGYAHVLADLRDGNYDPAALAGLGRLPCAEQRAAARAAGGSAS